MYNVSCYSGYSFLLTRMTVFYKISGFIMIKILNSDFFQLILPSLRMLDAKSLKEFLINYRNCRCKDGLALVQDKYQPFYQVLSTKMDYPDDYVLPTGTMKLQGSPIIPIQGGHAVEASQPSHAVEGIQKKLT